MSTKFFGHTTYNCPYCQGRVSIVSGQVVYSNPRNSHLWVKKFHLCFPCWAYVGTHDANEQPYGTLANRETRAARNQAHKHFDALWQHRVRKGEKKQKARIAEYQWLARVMGLPIHLTHIGLFAPDQCEQVKNHCLPRLAEYRITV